MSNQVPIMVQPDLSDPVMQMKGQKEDPNSVASLNVRAQVLQAQAIADSKYDPPVPPPSGSTEPFTNNNILIAGVAKDNIRTRIIFFIAGLILIVFLCWYVSPKGTYKEFSTLCGFVSGFKLPRIFRR